MGAVVGELVAAARSLSLPPSPPVGAAVDGARVVGTTEGEPVGAALVGEVVGDVVVGVAVLGLDEGDEDGASVGSGRDGVTGSAGSSGIVQFTTIPALGGGGPHGQSQPHGSTPSVAFTSHTCVLPGHPHRDVHAHAGQQHRRSSGDQAFLFEKHLRSKSQLLPIALIWGSVTCSLKQGALTRTPS